jgi:DNA (cytosine-5)-methyltransferase 1
MIQTTFGSLFSGAGGFELGLESAGLSCRWQVEIDPTARDVLAKHWPDVLKREDVRECGKRNLGRVDVVCGGFPCQDLSVAGKREGLGGDRSGLWWNMLRIVNELRPDYVVWENVPGLLSSDGGRDFERVIRSLGECGYFGCTRILDARHFGVPQRRRRVFGVFARGRFGAERCAEILALRDRVPGHPAAGREAGEDVAGCLSPGAHPGCFNGQDAASGLLVGEDGDDAPTVAYGIRSDANRNGEALTPSADAEGRVRLRDPGFNVLENLSPTLDSSAHRVGGSMGVRRLTPRECERLMSWPDDHTRYRADGREIADGPRYRLCGNGVVSNVVAWIGRRLMASP